jgi:hypothetical protein
MCNKVAGEMRVSTRLQRLLTDALSHSLPVHTMIRIVKQIIHNYDIYERSGFPPNIPIPTIDAARQITLDIIEENLVVKFVEALMDIYENGLMGRNITIRFLPQIIKELESSGLIYDDEYKMFIEKSDMKKTIGWGVLQENNIYDLTFMRIDIVNNSELVRKYTKADIASAYSDLREIFKYHVEKRNGRIWYWEGDGGIAAFYFQDKNVKAVLSGIDILLELFSYNLLHCNLKEAIQIRLAVHTGPCQFCFNIQNLQSETLDKLKELETKYTPPDHLAISPGVYHDMGSKLEHFFLSIPIAGGNYVYRYSLQWET